MNLLDIIGLPSPGPWAEGDKIPWHDPAFSQRMLREHLSQAHDAASRRAAIIDQHVAFIHHTVLRERATRVLDLGCGPGLYTARLAQFGHDCTGMDFAPAAIAYATETAAAAGLRCAYHLADLRTADFGAGFGLAMLLFGELNAFRPAEALAILGRARRALDEGGLLLLEAHTFAAVRAMGGPARTWRPVTQGVFSDRPHLRLEESAWDEQRRVATHRYAIVDAETAAVERYAESAQAYTDEEYGALLRECGFALRSVYPSLDGTDAPGDFVTLLAATV